jgi:hypothetical protein
MEHLELDVLWLQDDSGLRDGCDHDIPGPDPIGGPGRLPVDEDTAFHQGPRLGPADPEQDR